MDPRLLFPGAVDGGCRPTGHRSTVLELANYQDPMVTALHEPIHHTMGSPAEHPASASSGMGQGAVGVGTHWLR